MTPTPPGPTRVTAAPPAGWTVTVPPTAVTVSAWAGAVVATAGPPSAEAMSAGPTTVKERVSPIFTRMVGCGIVTSGAPG